MNKISFIKNTILLHSIFFCCSNNVFAQTKLTILYKNSAIKGSQVDYLKPNSIAKYSGKFSIDEFTINDTITYYQTVESFEEKDEFTVKAIKKLRNGKPIGKTFIPHSSYCNYATGINIKAVEWKDNNYLVKDAIANKQKIWNLTEDTKTVFGYACKQAFTLNGEEKDMIVWYTESLKCNLSSTGDSSLPGLILETYYPKTGILISAIDLQIETNSILSPISKIGTLVTKDEFEKIKKSKKD